MSIQQGQGHVGPPQPWHEGEERELLSTRIFRVTQARVTSPTRAGVGYDAVRLVCPDWVNVLALTPEGGVVLIEQYRHGIRDLALEIPGGMAEPGESPEDACARELREETGFVGDPVRLLGHTQPNPAFQDNRLYTGLVRNARQVEAPAGDGHEEITVSVAPLSALPDLVRTGRIRHALVLAALHLLTLDS